MWEAFCGFIFWGMEALWSIVGDWGLAIILATLVLRLLLFPLMQSQSKSSYKMQKVQPLIQDIQERYADHPQRMQEELQKVYAETKFNPLAGCLPLILQMPIFIAMFQILRDDGGTFIKPYAEQTAVQFYGIVPDLTMTPGTALDAGFGVFLPYIILLLLFALITFIPMLITTPKDSPQYNTTIIMGAVMSIMMLFIGWGSPAGVLLFWATSSIFALAQNLINRKLLKHEDDVKEAEYAASHPEPVKVQVVRKEKKKRPTKKH
ncbi:MAG: YidC/Oxa1 family membrane protein insertase [Eggerthellaceae bacterium]